MSKSDKISIIKYPDVASAAEHAISLIGPGDAVLVKGSNSTKVSSIAEMIRSLQK